MTPAGRWTLFVATLAILGVGGAPPVHAQTASPEGTRQVISANPFGLVFEIFNAEYERVVGESSTAGLGGSFVNASDESYLNADVFWRFYPGAEPLEGWAFGAKLGITNVPDQGTYAGYGFDLNRSWVLGTRDNFYVGAGFGLKRLIGAGDEDFGLEIIPTIRIVNVGIVF